MSGFPDMSSTLAPFSPGATRISKTVNVPVHQEVRIQTREIRVPQIPVVEHIQRIEKIKEIVRVVEKKVIVEEVKVVDQVYHPKEYRDIEVHVPVFEYIDQPITRTIVRYFAKDQADNVAAVEKRNDQGATLIRPNIKTHTVPIPVINYRPIKKERVFVPHKEVPGEVAYKFVDADTKQELTCSPDQIERQPTQEPVIRQLNSYVPARKVKALFERPVPQAVPGPIQDVYVEDVAQILDPEVRAAYEEWIANGREGKVRLNRVEYEVEYRDVDTVLEQGATVASVVPDVQYEVVPKKIVEPVERIQWVDVEEQEADALGLPKTEQVAIVAHAGDVVIINPVPGEVSVTELPTIIEQGPARFVVTGQVPHSEPQIHREVFHFAVPEERADVNLKILQAQNQVALVQGECEGAVTAEAFEEQILAIQRDVEQRNQDALTSLRVAEHMQEAELIEQLAAQGLNFTDYLQQPDQAVNGELQGQVVTDAQGHQYFVPAQDQ